MSAAGLARALCRNISRSQATKLLQVARANAKPVQPKQFGSIGPEFLPDNAYACVRSEARFGTAEPAARIPLVVEAWAAPAEDETELIVCINRTMITGEIEVARDKRDIDLFGCGLAHTVAQAPREKHFTLWLNIITPYMPITSDGKAPDLKPFLPEICSAAAKAVKKAHRPDAKGGSQKDVVLEKSMPRSPLSAADSTASASVSYSMPCAPSSAKRSGAELSEGTSTPGAARLDLPSASRRDTHARHLDGRGIRAPDLDLQQAGLHREGGLRRSTQGSALGRAARLRPAVEQGLLDPRRARSGR